MRSQGLCNSDICVDLKEVREGARQILLGVAFRAEERASAKALRLVCAQCLGEQKGGQGFYSTS